MSSKFKVLNIALVAILALGFFTLTTKADVTGNFGIHFLLVPQNTENELSVLYIDFETELNLTYVVSGLSTTLHTHFGIAGVEDVILTSSATLGALDLTTQLVFARFSCGSPNGANIGNNCYPSSFSDPSTTPFYPTLHFIKKRVTASVSLGGVTFSNLAVFEDVNAFGQNAGLTVQSGVLGVQSVAYAFGDDVSISGQTPSGVGLFFDTALCLQNTPNVIKKHILAPNSVNPDCVAVPKPDILFDRESIAIVGVPIATGVSASGFVDCVKVSACSLETDFTFNTPSVPIPFTATFSFTDLTSLSFSGAKLVFNAGAGTLTVTISPTGTIAATSVVINAVLNPDTNPAQFIIKATIKPGTGLTTATVTLAVTRLGFTMSATASFTGGPPAKFSKITFAVSVPGGLVSFSAKAVFTTTGLTLADIFVSVSF
ncbi:hypothetical protein HY229_01620 [Candidatus Acetothermia bacterium]|nr:hypothetical protein [Candidatus Acetothermia bacterium]MBI3642789.1 hypothetical protein [Candidatus Acetothermia bacterium]